MSFAIDCIKVRKTKGDSMGLDKSLPMGSCRGQKSKEDILSVYELEEVFHGIALNDKITGCCEDKPLAEYHRFDFKIRNGEIQTNLPQEGVMYVGTHCAKEFRKLMMERGEGHNYPTLFNPLMETRETQSIPTGKSTKNNMLRSRPPITVEAENALSLMMSLFPNTAENKGAILNIYNEIRNHPYKQLHKGQIKGINTSIGNYLRRTSAPETLVEIAEQVASARGENIRNFRFPKLKKALDELKTHDGYQYDNSLSPD